MISVEQALHLAKSALARRFDSSFEFENLKATFGDAAAHVFRVKSHEQTLICKVMDVGAVETQYNRLLWADMNGIAAPRPVMADENVLIMQDLRGQSFDALWANFSSPIDAFNLLSSAGSWLAEFHTPSYKLEKFKTAPHMNWIERMVDQHHSGKKPIPDFETFEELFPKLENLAEDAEDKQALRAITHQDLNSGNILVHDDRVFGLDFENSKNDDAVRDVFFFLTDLMILWEGDWQDAKFFAPAFQHFFRGYDDRLTHASVYDFFQMFYVMNRWAEMDATQKLGQNRVRRLSALKKIANSDRYWASPSMEGSIFK